MDKRRKIQDRNSNEYKRIKREVANKCREDKSGWFEQKCRYIQKLEEEGRMHEMHKEVKWLMKTQKKKRNRITLLENDAGELCSTRNEIEDNWIQYIEKLFRDANRDAQMGRLECQGLESAPDITAEELEYAIRKAKTRKATGADGIPVKVLKCASKKSKEKLLKLINRIHRTRTLPEGFKLSTFMAIHKKTNPRKCSEYRTIALMSHTLKLLLAIINRRIEARIDQQLSKTQFGFIAQKGTRDAIALYKILIQRALAV